MMAPLKDQIWRATARIQWDHRSREFTVSGPLLDLHRLAHEQALLEYGHYIGKIVLSDIDFAGDREDTVIDRVLRRRQHEPP